MPKPMPPEEPGSGAGPLSILLSCPKCGAPFAVDDEVVSLACAHCGSLLVLCPSLREELYIADGQIAGPDDLRAMVLAYRVQSQRAEIIARWPGSAEEPPPELWIANRLAAFEDALRASLAVLEARRILVPYWHLSGLLVQSVLGRFGDGPKQVRLRGFVVEHTVPAYDTTRANLRDRGLRLARSRVRPLTVRRVSEETAFLPWQAVPEQSFREIDRWKGQDLEPGLEAVTRSGRFVAPPAVLVYRPYWVARVQADRGPEWVLADGQFRTIAGYPEEAEVRTLLAHAIPDPLRSGEESFRRVAVSASRCPDCGHEARLAGDAHVSACDNCHRGLAPTADGLRLTPYDHARVGDTRLDGDYLPFWRYGFSLQLGQQRASTLADVQRLLFPQPLPPLARLLATHLWVPAFRLLGTAAGDEAFKALIEWVHGVALEVEPGKIPLGGACTLWGATVPEEQARRLAENLLLAAHNKPGAARLNTAIVRNKLEAAVLFLGEARLVLVPFVRDGEALRAPSGPPRVPLLLLRGGPRLEAQRVTVQAARAEVERGRTPLPKPSRAQAEEF